jgi:transcription-repair coupling factor (superfamily II helicase)
LTTEDEISAFKTRLIDRFGKLPKEVESLFEALRFRWICKQLGFERLNFKGGKLRLYFLSDPQSSFFETTHFQKIMSFVAQKGKNIGLGLKQTPKELILVADNVRGLKGVKVILEAILGVV